MAWIHSWRQWPQTQTSCIRPPPPSTAVLGIKFPIPELSGTYSNHSSWTGGYLISSWRFVTHESENCEQDESLMKSFSLSFASSHKVNAVFPQSVAFMSYPWFWFPTASHPQILQVDFFSKQLVWRSPHPEFLDDSLNEKLRKWRTWIWGNEDNEDRLFT
jgi:hypothetical protein